MAITFNANTLNVVILNNVALDNVTFNGVEVFSSGPKPSEFHITIAPSTDVVINYTQSAVGAVTVDWGDGTTEKDDTNLTVQLTHSYTTGGNIIVKLSVAEGETCGIGKGITSRAIYTTLNDYSILKSAKFYDGVTDINVGAFNQFLGLAELTMQEVVTIGNAAISGQEGNYPPLVNLVFPETLTTVGSGAIGGLRSLASLTCLAVTPPTLGSTNFSAIPADCAIYVPSGSVTAYQQASGWSDRAAHIQAIPT